MGKKVPVIIYADPDEETQFTIKPFAAGLAKKVEIEAADGPTGTATASHTSTPDGTDTDYDYDYSG